MSSGCHTFLMFDLFNRRLSAMKNAVKIVIIKSSEDETGQGNHLTLAFLKSVKLHYWQKEKWGRKIIFTKA